MNFSESRTFRPLSPQYQPSRILIIRLHAIGDVAITLPYCTSLRKSFPNSQIDFLTTEPCAGLPQALTIFDNVLVFPHCSDRWERAWNTLAWCARISKFHYDVVLDLQRNRISRAIRRSAFPTFWGEFDRFSPTAAGDRVLDTLQRTGFEFIQPVYRMGVRHDIIVQAENILLNHEWDGMTKLIVLNPAGLWITRNWPVENYIELGNRWLAKERVQFLLMGSERIGQKARYIAEKLPDSTINLVGKTTLAEAFGILQYASAVISEDSGLMHMAWVSGIPTLALFGSSRQDWSRPLGKHSVLLHSGDLECGACMKAECQYGDVHCLTRYTAEEVYKTTQKLLHASALKIAL